LPHISDVRISRELAYLKATANRTKYILEDVVNAKHFLPRTDAPKASISRCWLHIGPFQISKGRLVDWLVLLHDERTSFRGESTQRTLILMIAKVPRSEPNGQLTCWFGLVSTDLFGRSNRSQHYVSVFTAESLVEGSCPGANLELPAIRKV
jgi:hypothetical protein